MRVTTAMLADAAALESSGKLYIHGGGVTQLRAQPTNPPSSEPLLHRGVTLVLIFETNDDDAGRDIQISVGVVDEDERPTGTGATGVLNVTDALHARPVASVPFAGPVVLPFSPLAFPHIGRYRFRILVDDEEVESVPFLVSVTEEDVPSAEE